jgi:hypothetical protein
MLLYMKLPLKIDYVVVKEALKQYRKLLIQTF